MGSEAGREVGSDSTSLVPGWRWNRDAATTTHRTFCRWCPALCGVLVDVVDGTVTSVRGDPDHPLSRGYTCPKGRALGLAHHDPQRLDVPLVRIDGQLRAMTPDEAIDDLARITSAAITESGPDAVGVYHGTAAFFDAGRGPFDALLRALGSRSRYTSLTIDCPSKPLVSELVAGHRLMPIVDWERTKLVVFIGTNPIVSHGQNLAWPDPVVRVRELSEAGEVWVIDPRRTETARIANRHLQIRPGTDDALLAWLVRELLEFGADRGYLREHASQVAELRAAVAPFSRSRVAALCDVPGNELDDLLSAIRRAGRIAVMTGTGTSMGPTANTTEWLTWALMIVTGSYDQPGGMWFNPGYFAQLDHQAIDASDGRAELGAPSRPELPRRNDQWPCAAIPDEIDAGNLRVLFVVGGNPMTAFPQPERFAAAARRLDALVVLDVVANATSRVASHVLPCPGPLERADLPLWLNLMQPMVFGQYTPAVLPRPSGRKPLWWWAAQLGRRLDHEILPAGLDPDVATDDDVLRPIADGSRTDFETLRNSPTGHVADDAVFGWVHSILPSGRWRLAPPPLVEQLTHERRPTSLVMIPRRQVKHLNSALTELEVPGSANRPEVLIHPADANERGIADNAVVLVTSDAGALRGVARLTPDIRPGAVSVPHGYGDPNVGHLVSDIRDVDPLTGMVLQSSLPVEVERVEATEYPELEVQRDC
jgi:anaerobic selenocysteine-containing dehydrogenase